MRKLKEFSNLLEKIYSAAINPDEYKGLASEIAAYMGSHSAVIQHRDTETGDAKLVSITENFTEKSLIDYGEHFYKVDEWVIRGSQTQLGKSFVGSDLISTREFENSECYADYGRFLGLYDTTASVFETSKGICAFGVHRDKGDADFEENDRRIFSLLIPHIKNSLELHLKLSEQLGVNSFLLDALSKNGSAVIIVDALMSVKFINGSAETILKKVGSLVVINGRLHARSEQISERMRSAVAGVVNVTVARSMELHIPANKGGVALKLKIAPVPGGRFVNLSAGFLAAVFIETNSVSMSLDDTLIHRYRLTRAESRLALAIISGESLRQYSETKGVGIETVRTQMKQILSKTGTHRQLDFIKLVTSKLD